MCDPKDENVGCGDIFDMCFCYALDELGPGRSTVEYIKRVGELLAQSHVVFEPTTEDKYYQMLGVLPPAFQDSYGFLVGEAHDHRRCKITKVIRPTFAAFIEYRGAFFVSKEALTIPEYKAKTLPA